MKLSVPKRQITVIVLPQKKIDSIVVVRNSTEWPEGTAARLHAIAMFLLLRPQNE